MEQYGRAGQTTNDIITQRVRFACWITKAIHTHSEYVILIACNNGYANAHQCESSPLPGSETEPVYETVRAWETEGLGKKKNTPRS